MLPISSSVNTINADEVRINSSISIACHTLQIPVAFLRFPINSNTLHTFKQELRSLIRFMISNHHHNSNNVNNNNSTLLTKKLIGSSFTNHVTKMAGNCGKKDVDQLTRASPVEPNKL